MTDENVELTTNSVNEDLAKMMLENIQDAIMFTDCFHRIIYVNQSFEKITGCAFCDISGKTPMDIQNQMVQLGFYERTKQTVNAQGMWQGDVWNHYNDGDFSTQYVCMEARKNKTGEITHYVSMFSSLNYYDATNETPSYRTLYYDDLTALPNRLLFEKQLTATEAQWKKTKRAFAIAFFQLDNFSEINEEYGIFFGNVILQRIASRMQYYAYSEKLMTRWSGTEFACIIDDADVEATIAAMYQKVIAPMVINGREISLKVTFGVYVYDGEEQTLEEFLTKAHTALKTAKHQNKEILFYDKQMHTTERIFIMEHELKRAIKEQHFELYYQPLVSVSTGDVVCFEGLIRWQHPTEGIISPIKFIPLAEQTGLIEEIGDIVFEKACQQTVEWARKGFGNVRIYVNISMNQFKNKWLTDNIADILKRTGANANNIGIELTESSISLNAEETITQLEALKEMGLCIAIDDFGTGYASFSYLIDFPVNRIKIDRSYMKVINENQKIRAIVSAITHIGKQTDIEVVAEGIETETQLQQVKQLDIDIVQGYIYDRPNTKDIMEEKWLQTSINDK